MLRVMPGGDPKLGPREMPSSSIPDGLEKMASDIESSCKISMVGKREGQVVDLSRFFWSGWGLCTIEDFASRLTGGELVCWTSSI